MLKRNVSVAVAAALALSLAACGSSPASSAASSEAVSSEAVSSEAASSEATAAPAAGDFDVDQDITVISREDGSGTSGVLTAVSNDETAIGYISLGSLNNDVKAVTVEGVAPSADTVKDGTYTLARPFNIVTNGEAADPVAVDFIAYCMSTDGQALATEEGYIGDVGADYTSTQPAGKIVVGGSSSVSPLMEKLIEAYKTVNPNATLELQTTDSTTGVSGALDGTYTIGMASRELKDSEVEGGAKATVLAKDGIAVIVSNDNPTDNLTVDQIKGIYTGELTTWADVQ